MNGVIVFLAAWCGLSIPAALLTTRLLRTNGAAPMADVHDDGEQAPAQAPDLHAFVFYGGPRDGEITDDLSVLDTAEGPAGQYGPSGKAAVVQGAPRHVLQWYPTEGRRNPPYCTLAEHPGCPAYGMAGA